MQAVVFEEPGEPAEVLACQEKPVPEPASGEVRVRMLYSPVNPSDLMFIRGRYGIRPNLPATPGFEGVGIVEASGGGLLGKLVKGKRVVVLNKDTGNWAEQTVVPAKQVVPIPDDLPLEQAAMFFVNPATSFVLTREVLKVPQGGWLLQTAAGSALGQMIIRLSKVFGFKTINVVRREAQVEELKALGADAVVCYDGNPEGRDNFVKQVKEIIGNQKLKCAIDPVGGSTGSAAAAALSDNGKLVVYGSLSNQPIEMHTRQFITHNVRIEGFWLSRHMQELSLLGKLSLVKKITKLMRDNTLQAEVGNIFELAQIKEAVRESEAVGKSGKVLLKIAAE
ncbi:Alcohol dehydrogenase [Polystyrenella longa]|uniref:Alcohol dehydrogenase n=1 Tax=Polystyrenella longa TaxID=2528007 RepID=A0A518CNT9_9PLAN|nr:zinc-dependent alcohol dehydrogenase family protein [Polystyrenella longa]QDU80895.1 Alcohol dehydrogenase [Polystyrenella longa]